MTSIRKNGTKIKTNPNSTKQFEYLDNSDYDFLLKFIVIGDPACGKSCLLNRFVENKWKPDTTHTIGVEFGSKLVEISDKTIKLQIWDTAGQERFRSVTRSYYRNGAICILVYDITKRESYNNIAVWLQEARDVAMPYCVFILVGNKLDLQDERKVTVLEASRFAQENDLMFLETSAKTGDNVEEVFMKSARSILGKIDTGIINPNNAGNAIQFGGIKNRKKRDTNTFTQNEVDLENSEPKQNNGGCCGSK